MIKFDSWELAHEIVRDSDCQIDSLRDFGVAATGADLALEHAYTVWMVSRWLGEWAHDHSRGVHPACSVGMHQWVTYLPGESCMRCGEVEDDE